MKKDGYEIRQIHPFTMDLLRFTCRAYRIGLTDTAALLEKAIEQAEKEISTKRSTVEIEPDQAELSLSDRARFVIARLLNCDPTEVTPEATSRLRPFDLTRQPGCGPKTLKNIRGWLQAHGLHLGNRN